MSKEIYKKLPKYLFPLGMGYSEKEELIELLHGNFTPLEAEAARAIPTNVIVLEPVSVAEIPLRITIPKEQLESILSNLADRDPLFSKRMKDGEVK